MKKSRNILICPLEWGLGHAARMIPVARKLLDMNHNIIVAAGEKHLALFRAEMPGIRSISFPGFSPGYSRHIPQYLFMLLKTPLLLYHIIAEHSRLKKIIREYSIDIVISDNRFGLWNNSIRSVYVTHMPRIPLPRPFRILEVVGMILHRFVISRYTRCFIPDLPGEINVSGRLSHGLKLPGNVRYIGILSRFPTLSVQNENSFSYPHNTVILSGPEPQRGMLKIKLAEALLQVEPVSVILEGKPGDKVKTEKTGNIIFYNHLNSDSMSGLIRTSESIISRSGYTTIMDLIALNRTALLIPTPGQTEQEYLAEYLSGKGWFRTIKQNEIRPGMELPYGGAASWHEELAEKSRLLLEEALREILEEQQE